MIAKHSLKMHLDDEHSTIEFGAKLAKLIPSKGIIFLHGTLGAGKTTLVRGILLAAGHQGSTKSPTYTLVEPYQLPKRKFYHFDLYRIADPEELEYMGFRDYLDEAAVCLIEWPQKGDGFLPKADCELSLSYEGESRSITLKVNNPQWNSLLELFQTNT